MRWLQTAIVAAALWALPATAAAQADPDEATYQRAAQLRTTEPEMAREMYQQLIERTHAPRALTQLGLLEGQLGRWLPAEDHLAAALSARDDPWMSSRRGAIEANLAEVRRHISELTVVANVPGAALRVNGVEAGSLPLARGVRVAVGQVIVDVDAQGYEHVRQAVQATPGSTRVELVLVPVVPANSAATTPREPARAALPPAVTEPAARRGDVPADGRGGRGSPLVGPVVVSAIGGVALGTALVFFLGPRQSALDALVARCPYDDHTGCPPSALPLLEPVTAWNTATNVALIGGGAVLAAGLVWLAVGLASGAHRAPPAAARAVRMLRIAPAPGGLSLSLGGAL